MSSFQNGSGSLRPTWSRSSGGSQGGKGFQPPPAVPVERRTRSGSQGSSGSNDPKPTNKFAALDDDDDEVVAAAAATASSKSGRAPPFRSGSFGADRKSPAGPGRGGRSLADLAATVPEATIGRANSAGYRSARSDSFSEVAKVTRFTREKLLALRPRPEEDGAPPEDLKHLDGNPILSPEPLDPDCWDTFDADEIWAQAARERTTTSRSSSMLAPKSVPIKPVVEPIEGGGRRTSAPGLGKWQRGVALPPPDENAHRRGSRPDAENPNDLWDDPLAATDAAADFSAFGAIPDDPKDMDSGGFGGGGDAFDFDKMTEATQMFDDERRGIEKPAEVPDATEVDENGDENAVIVPVDPHRPLATVGTTIRSGSGDDVNVFEDFEDNAAAAAAAATAAASGVKAANEDPSASSRLMKMIGVTREETTISNPGEGDPTDPSASLNPWASGEKQDASNSADSLGGDSIPSNPWGQPIVPQNEPQSQQQTASGFDLAARLGQAAAEQQARDEQQRRQSQQEGEMRRRQEEESQRRAMDERARQQAMQQQQGAGHSQVELVLMERISVILENSWGRSDLMSILSTLHSEDSRVIPLLGNAEALRALIARHPRRIALRQDPAFGAEMAVLLLTNAQFQQQRQQQQEAQARAQQEEMQRRESLRMQQQHNQNGGRNSLPPIVPDAPWFYSDPQSNIQGPFRGEEMRQWLEAGYFKGDLPISQQPSGPFLPLSNIFQDLSFAFRVAGQSSDGEAEEAAREEEMRAKEEEERRVSEEQAHAEALAAEAAAAEAEALAHVQAQARMEAQAEEERLEREAAAEAEAQASAAKKAAALEAKQNEQNNSSAQLKMMLGLGQVESRAAEPINDEEPEAPKSPTKSKKSQKQKNQPAAAPSSPVAPPKPVWGNGVSAQVKRKSMAEIQQEEARIAALTAKDRKAAGRSSSGGWANVAASKGGSTGWQGGSAKPITPSSVVTGSNTTQTRMPSRPSGTKPAPPSRQTSAPAAMQPQHRAGQQQQNAPDDFGAAMSSSLEIWCKDQMRKLNGSDDLTLVSFCMTLNDPAEIRTYLNAYLGSTAQVNTFAADFINKRGLGKTQQEEWESTKPKKGRKKGGK